MKYMKNKTIAGLGLIGALTLGSVYVGNYLCHSQNARDIDQEVSRRRNELIDSYRGAVIKNSGSDRVYSEREGFTEERLVVHRDKTLEEMKNSSDSLLKFVFDTAIPTHNKIKRLEEQAERERQKAVNPFNFKFRESFEEQEGVK